jgi:hypothetical protein
MIIDTFDLIDPNSVQKGAQHQLSAIEFGLTASKEELCGNEAPLPALVCPSHLDGRIVDSSKALLGVMRGHLLKETLGADLLKGGKSSLQDRAAERFAGSSFITPAAEFVHEAIRTNFNFLWRSGFTEFGGIFLSNRDDFYRHPLLNLIQTYRLLQTALAQHADEGLPLIHIHHAGHRPAIAADAQYVRHYLTSHQSGFPGTQTRICLQGGEPYLISVVSSEAQGYRPARSALCELNEMMALPVNEFVGISGEISG